MLMTFILTGRRLGAIGINEVQSFSQQFSLPTVSGEAVERRYFLCKGRQASEIYEDVPGGPAESNNVTSTPVRFEYRVPDLQVQSVTPPVEVESDTAFDLAWTTKNFGNKTTGAMNEHVYFSTDAIVNANDLQIGSFALMSIGSKRIRRSDPICTDPDKRHYCDRELLRLCQNRRRWSGGRRRKRKQQCHFSPDPCPPFAQVRFAGDQHLGRQFRVL